MTRANRLFVQEVQRELIPESDETRVLISCHAALDTVTARTCRMQRPHSALYLCDVTPRTPTGSVVVRVAGGCVGHVLIVMSSVDMSCFCC